jgi:hypothetical protein
MNLRKAAEMAVDWFDGCQVNGIDDTHEAAVAAAEALRQALAQPPVDWEAVAADQAMTIAMMKVEKREWVGLTDADIAQTMHGSVEGSNMLPYQFARVIEAKLKEKNGG